MLSANVTGFESIKAEYANDEDFGNIYNSLANQEQAAVKDYIIREEFLFYKSRLCIPRGSFREFLIIELHGGGLAATSGMISPMHWSLTGSTGPRCAGMFTRW